MGMGASCRTLGEAHFERGPYPTTRTHRPRRPPLWAPMGMGVGCSIINPISLYGHSDPEPVLATALDLRFVYPFNNCRLFICLSNKAHVVYIYISM